MTRIMSGDSVKNIVSIGSPGVTIPPMDNVISQAVRNEEKGYDSIWWPDHLMGWIPQSIWTPDLFGIASYIPSPNLFLETTTTIAAVAARTKRITLGTAVIDAIRRHPAVLAQTIMTLDHIAQGRLIIGIGTGERENTSPYGLPYDRLAERMEEAINIMRLLWRSNGSEVSYDGKFWKLKNAVLHLPPYAGKPPQIWIAAHRRRMLQIVGRHGDGWLPTQMTKAEYRKAIDIIEKEAKESGRDPSKIVRGMWAWTILARDEASARRMLDSPFAKATALILPSEVFEELGYEHPLGKKFYGLTDYVPNHYNRADAMSALERVPVEVCERAFLFGTPEQVVRRIEEYAELGLQHIVLWNCTYFCDFIKLGDSFHCMDEIMRHFQKMKEG
jgi:phthiodiolone/phenolphthiodiolone dimycocerosates ketoreductase